MGSAFPQADPAYLREWRGILLAPGSALQRFWTRARFLSRFPAYKTVVQGGPRGGSGTLGICWQPRRAVLPRSGICFHLPEQALRTHVSPVFLDEIKVYLTLVFPADYPPTSGHIGKDGPYRMLTLLVDQGELNVAIQQASAACWDARLCSSLLFVFLGKLVSVAQYDLPLAVFAAVGLGAAQGPGRGMVTGVTGHVL